MYHDRYSRRRATDSFHEEEDLPENNENFNWSWLLMLGVLLVQVTSRNIWASFGVISAFLFGDNGPSWLLLTTPTAFAVSWGLTDPWIRKLTKKVNTTTDIMYIIAVGMILAWLGAMIAAKSPIQTGFIIALIGSVGGVGSSIMAAASITLLQKNFPTRTTFVRLFEEITTSTTFFLMPIISYFIMDTFGDHGGILIHSGVIMQGLVGAVILRGAKWKTENTIEIIPRPFSFDHNEENVFFDPSESYSNTWTEKYEIQKSATVTDGQPSSPLNTKPRVAFGLGNLPHTPPPNRRRRKHRPSILPSIAEDEEEEESSVSQEDENEQQDEIPPKEEDVLVLKMPPPQKPPRTFEHIFPAGRLLATLNDCPRGDFDEHTLTEPKHFESKFQSITSLVKISFEVKASEARNLFLKRCQIIWKHLTASLVIPCAFLLFVTQNALLTFVALTPVMLNEYIEDGTNLDGAYCVSVMGLTWLCFVLSSPCFSTIHFSNHQVICVVALCTSSVMLYLVSQSASLDELVLFACLFGLSNGVARLTTYSVLKIHLGKEMVEELSCLLYFISGVFHLLSLLTASLWDWGGHLKNLYALPCSTLALSAIFWTIQGFVSSVRADRGRHDVTWSRRRRFS